jgi:outer membrane protein
MIKRLLWILTIGGLVVTAVGQQTAPVQPKTVDPPKLTPLQLPGLPSKLEIVANAPLTAAEAVKIALAHQPQVAIAKANADAAHGQTLQSKAALNPTVGASGQYENAHQYSPGTGLVGAQNLMTTQVVLNQLIFDFNKTRDLVSQSQALERASYRTFDQTLQDVALQAKEDFYSYVQAKQQSKVQEANVLSRQAQVDLTQAQVSAGTGEPSDLVTAKTLLSQSVITLSQAMQAEKTAGVKLATDMGIDPRTPIVVAPSIETNVTLPTDLNSLVDLGLKQRPTILSAVESLRAAGYGVSVARKTNVPTISAQVGFDTSGERNPFAAQTGFLAVTLNWTLLDGGLQLGKVRQAKAEQTVAAQVLKQASQDVIQDVSNAVVSVQAARQQIPVAASEVANAEEGIRLSQGRYKAGVTTFQEVITAQAALVQAQTDQVTAVAALAIALSTLDHAIGKWPVD